jgi:glyoxylase-like metal-dependent hydrolase (beta-lactamase superfamily II)
VIKTTLVTAAGLAMALLSGCGGAAHAHYAVGGLDVHTFTRDSTNVHLVSQGGNTFMFDSGYEANAQQLEDDVRAAGIDPAALKAIIISHGHADHAGGAKHFHDRFEVPVVIGDGDQGMFTTGKHDQPLCSTGLLGSLRHDKDAGATYSGSVPDRVISSPTDLKELTGIEGQVLPLAGHTRGSLVVVVGELVLVGDLLRGSLVGSGAATHLYMCDLKGNQQDIAHLMKDLAPGATQVFTGHFGPVSRESVLETFEVR